MCRAYWAWVAALALVACNGDDDDDDPYRSGITTCGEFSACGGDLQGTWRVAGFCSDDFATALGLTSQEAACRDAVRATEIAVAGTYTFGSDGNLLRDFDLSMDSRIVWSPACLRALIGPNVDLPGACGNISDNLMDRSDVVGSACAFDGSNCDCEVSRAISAETTETYRVSGTRILQPDDQPADYCVSGDTLTIVEHEAEADTLTRFTRVM